MTGTAFKRNGDEYTKIRKVENKLLKNTIKVNSDSHCLIQFTEQTESGHEKLIGFDVLDRAECIEMASILFFMTDHFVDAPTQYNNVLVSDDTKADMTTCELINHYSSAWFRHKRLTKRSEVMTLFRMFLERCEDEDMVMSLLASVASWGANNAESDFHVKSKLALEQINPKQDSFILS